MLDNEVITKVVAEFITSVAAQHGKLKIPVSDVGIHPGFLTNHIHQSRQESLTNFVWSNVIECIISEVVDFIVESDPLIIARVEERIKNKISDFIKKSEEQKKRMEEALLLPKKGIILP